MRFRSIIAASMVAAAGVAFPVAGVGAVAQEAPEGVYGATAVGSGLSVFVDSEATGGAFYAANAAFPFTEATVETGSVSEGIASYAYDRNAVTGVYFIGSATFQANGGPAFPDIPNTASARYPARPRATADFGEDTEVGPAHVRAARATADTSATRALADARAATFDLPDVISASVQESHSTAEVVAEGTKSYAVSLVKDISIAGGVLRIGEVHSEALAIVDGSRNSAQTAFRVVDASVGGVPVTIGADGVRVAGDDDGVLEGALEQMNLAIAQNLASNGIEITFVAGRESEDYGASARAAGLKIQIRQPGAAGAPGATALVMVGRTSADASFSPPPPIPPPPPPPEEEDDRRVITTVVYEDDPPVMPPSVTDTPDSPVLVGARRMPPAPLLFGLWQISTFGWVVIAWWRRRVPGGGIA